tara:strand:- start:21 stop:341 length:321 start_codon:yes stop_codon:yes gene_type:complete
MCVQIKYTSEAMTAIFSTGDNRKEAISSLADQAGGKLISFYGMQGQHYHMMIIVEMPSMANWLAFFSKGMSGGAIEEYKNIQLIDPEIIADSSEIFKGMDYRAPGQ